MVEGNGGMVRMPHLDITQRTATIYCLLLMEEPEVGLCHWKLQR